MALHTWLVYLLAAAGLSLTPGPNSLLALTHGALYGHRRALLTVTGGVIGFVVLMALSMLGIGTLLQASTQALTVLRWVGGAYLVWLGVVLLRAPAMNLTPLRDAPARRDSALFRQGLLAAVSNPKVVLFYGAFLPQFIDPQGDLVQQFLIMAVTFAATEFLVEYALARLAHVIRPRLERAGRRFNQACGCMFVLLGAALPLT